MLQNHISLVFFPFLSFLKNFFIVIYVEKYKGYDSEWKLLKNFSLSPKRKTLTTENNPLHSVGAAFNKTIHMLERAAKSPQCDLKVFINFVYVYGLQTMTACSKKKKNRK